MAKVFSRLRGRLLAPCCVLAIAAAAVLIGCFIRMVAVQTSWKRDLQTLERQFSRAYAAGAVLSREATEETVLAGSRDLNYFLRVLNLPGSMATHSGKKAAQAAEDSRTLALQLPDYTLYYSPYDEGHSVCVSWQEDGGSRAYVIGGGMEFSYLEIYFSNMLRAAAAEG